MNTADYIEIAKNRIVERFHPLRVLLFGSQARENPRKDSDIDLLVVMSEAVDKRQTAIEIRRSLNDLPISKDIIVTTTISRKSFESRISINGAHLPVISP
jgi:predicted nucleotidyltransferase